MITAESIIGEAIAKKKNSEFAKVITNEFFVPKGKNMDTKITFWEAAEKYDKKACLQTILDILNKMPDLLPAE